MLMRHRLLLIGLVIALAMSAARAQSLEPSFDVASVKQNTSANDDGQWGIMPPTPTRLRIANTPLRFILHYAFDVRDHQLIGAPEWADSARFEPIDSA